MSVFLGIDVGEKKIGLAVGNSETGWTFTRPPLLVETWNEAWPAVKQIIVDEFVDTVVVGLPLGADGQISTQAARVKEFVKQLGQQVSVPILERDERHTTHAVQKEQVGQKLARGQEDSLAAQLLVEAYIEEMKS